MRDTTSSSQSKPELATLAGGCFWCVEAVFRELRGVQAVRSGYVGGTKATADYRTVCSGRTDHVEAIEIVYDAALTSFGQLLKIHFSVAHDPTQIDRQGNDVGRQYRSVVFYANEEQQRIAEAYVRELNDAKVFMSPVVTAVEPLKEFFAAEDYHQKYYLRSEPALLRELQAVYPDPKDLARSTAAASGSPYRSRIRPRGGGRRRR